MSIPSGRTGRLWPRCWPISWRSRHKLLSLPQGPFLCAIRPKYRKFLCKFAQFAVLAFLLILLILWSGMAYEQAQVRRLPDTESLYTVPQVCALTYNDTSVVATTFLNASLVEQSRHSDHTNTLIAHCGDCGQCSTPHDIRIYDDTRNTLFQESIVCAKHGLIGGYRGASRCMSQRVGFTHGCNDCWVENIMCDLRKCIFSCFYHAIFSRGVHGGSSSEELNRCTQCDESRCGPAFLQCAGANRRRTAIISDIERNVDVEVCSDVQTQWWLDEDIQTVWRKENVKALERGSRRRERLRAPNQAKRDAKLNSTGH